MTTGSTGSEPGRKPSRRAWAGRLGRGDPALGQVGEEVAAAACGEHLLLAGLEHDDGEEVGGAFGGDPVHGRQGGVDGEQDEAGADGVGAVAAAGDVDAYAGVAQALPGQQGVGVGGAAAVVVARPAPRRRAGCRRGPPGRAGCR